MPLLRRGITGFDAQSEVDVRSFSKAVYAAALNASGSVVEIKPANGVTPNFHVAAIKLHGRDLCVICNRTFPVIAFVRSPIEMAGLQPMDVPELAESFRISGFEVASAADLQRPIEAADMQLLSDAERAQATYWKPQRIGHVLFNWWD